EVIYRTIKFYQFARSNISLSGAMLSLNQKNTLSELGSNFFNNKMSGGSELIFSNQELSTTLLNKMSKPFEFQYGGWWYFCFSEESVQSVGLPFPFFIRGDDVEYGLRLSTKGIKTIPLPGVGVWHEVLSTKL